MEITTCPECGAPAEVRGRSVWESTGGPVEHIRIECVARHWFLMSVASLAAAVSLTEPATFGAADLTARAPVRRPH
jgi:hypothetical protein